MKLRPMPYPYRHPGKAEDADVPSTDPKVTDAEPSVLSERSDPVERRRDGKHQSYEPSEAPAVTIRIGIPIPLVRTASLYGRLRDAGFPERTVALKIARRAINCWLETPAATLRMPATNELIDRALTVETTKAFDRTTFDRIAREFDPHSIHSARFVGRMFGHAVLTWWIATEAKT